jgi:hypothetical protein
MPFTNLPPLCSRQKAHSNRVHLFTEQQLIKKEILSLLCKNAIKEIPNDCIGFRCQLFTIRKKTGEHRPVLNLRPLNQSISHRHFKMKSLKTARTIKSTKVTTWTSIDLVDASLYVLVHQSTRRSLQFTTEGKLYQCGVFPFRLPLFPLVFTKVLRPVLHWAHRKGIQFQLFGRFANRIQGFPHVAMTHKASTTQTVGTRFLVKPSKSVLMPTQGIQHLDIIIDSTEILISVPRDKIRELHREVSRLLSKPTFKIRHLFSFVGKPQALTTAVIPARLQSRHLLADKNSALQQGRTWTSSIQRPPPAIGELLWWHNQLKTWDGESFLSSTSQHEILTDASDQGQGIV